MSDEGGNKIQQTMIQSNAADEMQHLGEEEEGSDKRLNPSSLVRMRLDLINNIFGNLVGAMSSPLSRLEALVPKFDLSSLAVGKYDLWGAIKKALQQVHGAGVQMYDAVLGGAASLFGGSDFHREAHNTGKVLHNHNVEYGGEHHHAAVMRHAHDQAMAHDQQQQRQHRGHG